MTSAPIDGGRSPRNPAHAQEELARAQGIEQGLERALGILIGLADVMIEREDAAKPGAKANWRRRTRIKAYQVAAARVRTQLDRQVKLLAKLESQADHVRHADLIKEAVEDLAL